MANIATRCLSSFVEAESSRKLVTIRKIGDLLPIVKADNLELAVVDGWRVVVRKGDVAVGDKCVFFEIDSFLPEGNDLWKHLVDKKSIVFNGKRGHRVKSRPPQQYIAIYWRLNLKKNNNMYFLSRYNIYCNIFRYLQYIAICYSIFSNLA